MPDFSSEKGYTLVEILVVIVILAIVSAGITTVFITGLTEYGVREVTIRMQQQARLAMYDLERELKLAGYGFMDFGNLKINVYSKSANAVVSWAIVEANSVTGAASNTDSILIRYQTVDPATVPDVTIATNHPDSSVNTPVSDASGFAQGDLFFIYDPTDLTKPASMLQVSTTPSSKNDTLKHSSGSNWEYNPPNAGINIFPPGGYGVGCKVVNLSTLGVKWVQYHVDSNSNLIKESSTAPQAHIVATGIEDLQIRYQFKDGVWLNAPVKDDANHDINNLRALKVSIIARTANPDPRYGGSQPFQLTGPQGDGVVYSGGGYRRMTMSSTISLRNLVMRDKLQ
ncbi:PilW family protein [Geobacter pickeringii]|uniref:Pilus assembly protein PilW n=1 Tax=Geobacter pickeringii TaxID=345632 RepID=A0A0B5BK11_9BACT|nr:PilW family protein [Geobacter pickeringii]AJE04820.1 hypothetical protein GPICK_05100 [Geobacter pickeringii]